MTLSICQNSFPGCFSDSFNLGQARSYLAATSSTTNNVWIFAGGLLPNNLATAFVDYSIYGTYYTANLSKPRYNMVAVSCQQFIFLAGGTYYIPNPNLVASNTVDILNSNTNTWTTANLSYGRTQLSATSLPNQGLVLFAGGYLNYYGYSGLVDIYNIFTSKWSISYLSSTRYNLAATSLPNLGLAFFAGGQSDPNIFYDVVDIYDANLNVWVTAKLGQSRYNLAAVAFPIQNIVLFGGGTNQYGNPFNYLDRFDINTRTATSGTIANPFSNPQAALIIGLNFSIFTSANTNNQITTLLDVYSPCPGGYYQSFNNPVCTPCPASFYCPIGNIDTKNCPPGTYCPATSVAPVSCPAGTYSPLFQQTSIATCNSCPAGTFNIFVGQTSSAACLPCSVGFYCDIASPIPLPCPNNYYCPSSTQKIACPIGTYSNDEYATNVSNCLFCRRGSFCGGGGKGIELCDAGTYANKEGMGQCLICPAGSYCNYGSSEPSLCPMNTYSVKGALGCTQCGEETFTINIGSVSCMSCPSSRFSVDGWWCMTVYEKILFVVVWVASFFSFGVSVWKIGKFVKERIRKLRHHGIQFSIKNFLFIERIIPQTILLNNRYDDLNPILEQYNLELEKLREMVVNLQNHIQK